MRNKILQHFTLVFVVLIGAMNVSFGQSFATVTFGHNDKNCNGTGICPNGAGVHQTAMQNQTVMFSLDNPQHPTTLTMAFNTVAIQTAQQLATFVVGPYLFPDGFIFNGLQQLTGIPNGITINQNAQGNLTTAGSLTIITVPVTQ